MIRNSIPSDVIHVAEHMRDEDQEEVRAVSGLSPLQALSLGIMHSDDCITGLTPEGEPAVMAGVVPLPDGSGAIWMLCTPMIFGHLRELISTAHCWVDEMAEKYGHLANIVDQRNTAHLRFVRHMGFALGAPIENHGPGRVPVIPITRGNRNV